MLMKLPFIKTFKFLKIIYSFSYSKYIFIFLTLLSRNKLFCLFLFYFLQQIMEQNWPDSSYREFANLLTMPSVKTLVPSVLGFLLGENALGFNNLASVRVCR